ncbi:MAG: hypothetical protein JW750_10895 [Anaerolineaceae bacterium]|nr:hypothetical protein [Anaerolineaceae bacterium]
MEIQPFSFEPKKENQFAKISQYSAGISWAVMFGFIFSDSVLDELIGGSEGVLICVTPLYFLSILGYGLAILTGLIAKNQIRLKDEEGADRAQSGISHGILGLIVVFGIPLLNPLLDRIGIQLFNVFDLFK